MSKRHGNIENLSAYLRKDEREVVDLIARRRPIEEIRERIGLPRKMIEELVQSAKLKLSANDDLVDDYLDLIDEWQSKTGTMLFSDFASSAPEEDELIIGGKKPEKAAIIEEIEKAMSPAQMRDLARSLLRLADAIDQDWSPENVQASFRWPSSSAKIEKNAVELAKRASVIIRQREVREEFLPRELFGEPGWNMLLDLFIQFAGGAKASGKSLCIAAACPQSTAIRHLSHLEDAGLILQEPCQTDRRVTLYSLSKKGVLAVGRFLMKMGG